MKAFRRLSLVIVLATILASCANLPATRSTVTVTNPSPSPGASASPSGICGAQATGAIYIAMASTITATNDPTYGAISGYAITDSSGNPGTTAAPIVLKPNDVIQFFNAESSATGPDHSAVGFPGAEFPAVPYAFPAAASQPTGSTLASGWSTGRIPINGVGICFSQTFTIPSSGVYYFGDLDFYNLTNFRDVIVVSNSAAE